MQIYAIHQFAVVARVNRHHQSSASTTPSRIPAWNADNIKQLEDTQSVHISASLYIGWEENTLVDGEGLVEGEWFEGGRMAPLSKKPYCVFIYLRGYCRYDNTTL